MTKRAAVVGHPIAHSLSPALHRAAYAYLGLDWTYDAIDVAPGQLASLLSQLDENWVGLSLTMPHKQDVIALLNNVEGQAKLLGSVNTVMVSPQAKGVILAGANTDVAGLVAAITPLNPAPRSATILGGGATARSALAALAQLGDRSPRVLVRSAGRSGALIRAATAMGLDIRLQSMSQLPDAVASADVVISTVPVGAQPELLADLNVTPAGPLLDIVYDPDPTPMVSWWRERGVDADIGLRMLIAQAAEQIRYFTSHDVPLEVLEAAVRS